MLSAFAFHGITVVSLPCTIVILFINKATKTQITLCNLESS